MLAVPYSRISSTGQIDGLGLERQAAAPQSYCAARGWQLWEGEAYSDAGRSAFDGSNLEAALGRFLADLRAGNPAAWEWVDGAVREAVKRRAEEG
jgi:DNA invertase Pin-like site-specific DNA recombinase